MDELPQFCRYFEDYHIASVEATIQRAVEESEERLMEQGRAAMEYADAHFTLEGVYGTDADGARENVSESCDEFMT